MLLLRTTPGLKALGQRSFLHAFKINTRHVLNRHCPLPSQAPFALTCVSSRRNASSFSFIDKLPGPVRSLIPVVGTASLLFFVAAPVLLVFLPPVCIGAMLYLRRRTRQRAQMFEHRWTDLASYHLSYQTAREAATEQDTLKRLVMRRVSEAIQDNEHGIASSLGFKVSSDAKSNEKDEYFKQDEFQRSHLALGDVHGIEEDWRVSPQGIAQNMTVYTMSLVDRNRDGLKVADVNIVVKSRVGSSIQRTKDVRIELTSAVGVAKQNFVLDGNTADGEGQIIDIKKR